MKDVNKTYKYRLYPTRVQEIALNKTFGAVRFYWNKLVESFLSHNKESKPVSKSLAGWRREHEWLGEVSYYAVNRKKGDFVEFTKQYFSKTRKRKINRPKYKSKRGKQSFSLSSRRFCVKDDKIRLEKIGWVKAVIDREIPVDSKVKSITVSKNPSNQYFASVLIEAEIKHKLKTNKDVGIDVGLKEFLVQSDNLVVANPRYFCESQARLKRAQQHFSRKKKGSRRREKARLKVARLHQKISNQRQWFLHNESTRLINNYDKIYVEDLCIDEMLRNRKLAKSISDASWSVFMRMLEYKAEWYGKEVVKIGRFSPSSKICSNCGFKKNDLTLKDRVFACPICGFKIDRDLNAAINIRALGNNNAIRTQSERKTSLDVVCNEAFSKSEIIKFPKNVY